MELGPGRVAVVTGAASGIGRALADAFAGTGMAVVMADVEEPALEAAAAEVRATGAEVAAVRVDVSSEADCRDLARRTLERFGAAHVVCNNAGVGGAGDPWEGPVSTWDWVLGVNLMGVVYGVRAFLPLLRSQGEGHIVNTASMAGVLPTPMGPYATAKYGVVGLSQSLYLSEQAAGTGVGVSVLCPGFVRTNIASSDRNWPAHLGAPPPEPAGAEAIRAMMAQALAEGMQPAAVADEVLDAIRSGHFWVLPHREFVDLIVAHAHAIAEGRNPGPLPSGTD